MKRIAAVVMAVLATGLFAATAQAIPALQLYIDGATYDTATETWVFSGDGDFTLWVLGDVGAYGTISGVKLTAAFETEDLPGSITLTPTTTSLVTDPSTPSSPTGPTQSADGAVPDFQTNPGQDPAHGVYGTGVSYFEWGLGDFSLTDSPIADFNGDDPFPTTFDHTGQINAYTVHVEGLSWVHFDAYDHYPLNEKKVKYVFAPFSHDAESVPEPGTLLLLGSGLLGLGLMRRRRS